MSVASWAKTSWDKARNRGVFSEHTAPKETITAESLAVFLDRAGLLDHINGPAIGHAVRLKKRMDDAQSSEYYVGEVIAHLRDHPSSGGGLSQSEADSRYVRRGTTVKLP